MNIETGEETEATIEGKPVQFKEDGENYNVLFGKQMNELFVIYHNKDNANGDPILTRNIFYERKMAMNHFKLLRRSNVTDMILVCGSKKMIIGSKSKNYLQNKILRAAAEKDNLLDKEGTEMSNDALLCRTYILLQPYQFDSALADKLTRIVHLNDMMDGNNVISRIKNIGADFKPIDRPIQNLNFIH